MKPLLQRLLIKGSGVMLTLFALGLASTHLSVSAGEADVIDVQVKALGDNRYRIDVTLEHADTGWDHYANKWEVLTVDGELLGTRELAHPHVNEQPFTRSLTLGIPAGITSIVIRAGDSVHEAGGLEMTVDLQEI